ncbi:hypothetical protein P3T76_013899 [Phytophthora citrophthora]|uniref:Uncharacterized protein n=1 Tax=Phytophthora citrophthora TaxID=4793 RepID=A0AAD9LCL1_9STRA|nr:hypothetical protein P3T76_013899 [Phytophthora citrophthora]
MFQLQKVMARMEDQQGSALEKMSGDLDAKLERLLDSKFQTLFQKKESIPDLIADEDSLMLGSPQSGSPDVRTPDIKTAS